MVSVLAAASQQQGAVDHLCQGEIGLSAHQLFHLDKGATLFALGQQLVSLDQLAFRCLSVDMGRQQIRAAGVSARLAAALGRQRRWRVELDPRRDKTHGADGAQHSRRQGCNQQRRLRSARRRRAAMRSAKRSRSELGAGMKNEVGRSGRSGVLGRGPEGAGQRLASSAICHLPLRRGQGETLAALHAQGIGVVVLAQLDRGLVAVDLYLDVGERDLDALLAGDALAALLLPSLATGEFAFEVGRIGRRSSRSYRANSRPWPRLAWRSRRPDDPLPRRCLPWQARPWRPVSVPQPAWARLRASLSQVRARAWPLGRARPPVPQLEQVQVLRVAQLLCAGLRSTQRCFAPRPISAAAHCHSCPGPGLFCRPGRPGVRRHRPGSGRRSRRPGWCVWPIPRPGVLFRTRLDCRRERPGCCKGRKVGVAFDQLLKHADGFGIAVQQRQRNAALQAQTRVFRLAGQQLVHLLQPLCSFACSQNGLNIADLVRLRRTDAQQPQ